MPRCKECGSFISNQFVKVFGNNEGDVYGCMDCGVNSSNKRHKEDLDHTSAIDF